MFHWLPLLSHAAVDRDRRIRRAAIRDRLLRIDRRCRYCRRPIRGGKGATLDHIIPISRGGTDHPSNLLLSCRACNVVKGNQTPLEWATAILAAVGSEGGAE